MTAPDRETGERLGRALVEERRAACANVIPTVTSIFWWEGAVERAEEVLVVLKTPAAQVAALVERAVELHPYDVPEVLALPVEAGHPAYLAWVREESGGAGAGR
ncbi:MAG: divalent-cation tolerance protein CutA [Gemmatimonadetes bacterium]|nr:divalent-cation tolerance protein CutA [Gemmatimonadota bacterium]